MSDEKIINLGSRRAQSSEDCRDWTPLDALKETIREIEAGEIPTPSKIAICMYADGGGDTATYKHRVAGCLKIDLLGLLTRHLQIIGSE